MTDYSYTRLLVHRVEKGNGNAITFIFPDNTLGIVDWGTDNVSIIRDLLDRESIRRLRFAVATHSHADHTIGLFDVLLEARTRGIPVDNFYYPAIGRIRMTPTDHLGRAAVFAIDNHIPAHPVSVYDFDPKRPSPPIPIAKGENWEVSILAPPSASNNRHQIKSHLRGVNPGNPTSIVLLFRYVASDDPIGRALLPGDATPAVLKFAANHALRHPQFHIDNDTFVAAHHGSAHNWPNWLTAHIKGITVISASTKRLGHPAVEVLESLSSHSRRYPEVSFYCTSYAAQCRAKFAKSCSNPRLVEPGPCFGDIEIELRPTGSHVISHDQDGPDRREFGFCGQ